jgi:hypothetical protein
MAFGRTISDATKWGLWDVDLRVNIFSASGARIKWQ